MKILLNSCYVKLLRNILRPVEVVWLKSMIPSVNEISDGNILETEGKALIVNVSHSKDDKLVVRYCGW